MKKIYKGESKKYEDQPIQYISLDTDTAHAQAKEYEVRAIPAYRVFKDGELVPELSFGGGKEDSQEALVKLSDKALKLWVIIWNNFLR